ncbi:GAF and ANTAR domain-containing protein [Nocardia sp. NPDC050710]|uniref:GAF and ANTAR domain-containing protein n=1 Tax=Nocardia sp. NPDC050710 TaxID=3157220 RepID=UPI0033DED978
MAQFELLAERFRSALRLDGGDISAACRACVRVLPVQRVAILVDEPYLGAQPWSTSDAVTARIEAVQTTVGEGPAFDAVVTGVPVAVADLATDCERWPGFAAALRESGVVSAAASSPGAMVAVPLRLGLDRLGALDLYRSAPAPWGPAAVSAGRHIADILAAHLLSIAADPSASPPPLTSAVIHQAAGMMISRGHPNPADAYRRLRVEALRRGLSLTEVAQRIVDRRIRLERGDIR